MSFTFNHEKQVDQMSFILFYKEGIATAAGVLAKRIESDFLRFSSSAFSIYHTE